jgi:hypothetical protein
VNVCVGFQKVNLKATQSTLEKIVAWIKKSNKGCNEWKWVCLDEGHHHQKQKTLVKTKFANKVTFFQKTLE